MITRVRDTLYFQPHSGMVTMERLDKYLASRGCGSRREVQQLVKGGAVTVDGAVCRQPDCKLDPDSAVVAVNGQAVGDKYVYLMLNKPAGVVSATEDRREKTVIDLLPEPLRRRGLFPAGRLDKDTEGLLILTNDGDFAHRMLSPKKHVDKQYIAQLDGEITEEMIARFAEGIVFADGVKCLPAKLTIAENGDKTVGRVTICEGKYHQVKKMFAVCGLHVVHLQRISIGNLYLDGKLPIGSYKSLTNLEIQQIFIGKIH